jgi:hypothetical protein
MGSSSAIVRGLSALNHEAAQAAKPFAPGEGGGGLLPVKVVLIYESTGAACRFLSTK